MCGAMPQPITTPRLEPSFGRITDASDGPIWSGPTSGLTTDPPCTSWSYWRMIQCLLAMFGWERRESRCVRAPSSGEDEDGGWRMEDGEDDGPPAPSLPSSILDPPSSPSTTTALRRGI